MQLKAYWIGNFIFDFIKLQVTIVVTICLFFGFELEYNAAWVTYVIFPFAVLPYTYVMSFIFKSDNSSQTFTMFFNFLLMGIAPIAIFVLRFIPQTQNTGDRLQLLFHVFPSYLPSSSVICDSNCLALYNAR